MRRVLVVAIACGASGPVVSPGERVVDRGVFEYAYEQRDSHGEERFAIVDRPDGGHAIHAEMSWSKPAYNVTGRDTVTIVFSPAWLVVGGRLGTIELARVGDKWVAQGRDVQPASFLGHFGLSFLAPLCLHHDESGPVALVPDVTTTLDAGPEHEPGAPYKNVSVSGDPNLTFELLCAGTKLVGVNGGGMIATRRGFEDAGRILSGLGLIH
jgi:hypothetical protein